jgi:hypothetical protein
MYLGHFWGQRARVCVKIRAYFLAGIWAVHESLSWKPKYFKNAKTFKKKCSKTGPNRPVVGIFRVLNIVLNIVY